jgi:hypothetical protein
MFVEGATGEAQKNPRRGSRPLLGLVAAAKEQVAVMHTCILAQAIDDN